MRIAAFCRTKEFRGIRERLRPYLAALGLVAIATVIRLALDPFFENRDPLIFYTLSVLVAAALFGTGPAILVTVAGLLIGTFLFIPPRFAFFPLATDAVANLAIFIMFAVVILLVVGRVRTQRQRLQKQQNRIATEAHEQRLLDAAHDYAIYELDREGRIVTWNKGAERLKGWKAEEIIGKPYTVLHPPESRARNAPDRELKIAAEDGRFEEEAVRMRKDGSVFAAHVSLFPLRDEHGDVTGFVKITRDISEGSKAGKAILESRRRMEAIVQSAMDAIITIGEDQRVVLFNPAAEKMFGYSAKDTLGQPVTMLIPERFRANHAAYVQRFFDSGVLNRPLASARPDLNGLRRSGEEFPIEASISQVTVDGERVGTIILRDITERRTSEEARALLTREVDHRAKNALAVTQALVSLTKADNVEDFADAIRGRIASLGRAHSLLSQSQWGGAPLEQLIHDELSPYAKADQIELKGPTISCSADAVQSLSLMFHELATNAVKHGALGSAAGNVVIEWELDAQELRVEWREQGGPPVKRPKGEGIGSRLLRQVAGRQLKAEIAFHWERDGLRVEIRMPAELFTRGRAAAQDSMGALDGARDTPLASDPHKILLVEDEELVALELSAELSRLGWAVVGPAGSLAEAQALLSSPVDAAVLDVNLRGRSVFPVAEQLEKLQVPFVFCTGYELADPEGRFPGVPVIRKPAPPAAVSAALATLLKSRMH